MLRHRIFVAASDPQRVPFRIYFFVLQPIPPDRHLDKLPPFESHLQGLRIKAALQPVAKLRGYNSQCPSKVQCGPYSNRCEEKSRVQKV
jgi:hypothetical protein